MNSTSEIWIAEDDRSLRWVMEKAISREGIEVRSFENGDEASGSVAEMALPRISSARMVPSELQTRLNENKQSRSMA